MSNFTKTTTMKEIVSTSYSERIKKLEGYTVKAGCNSATLDGYDHNPFNLLTVGDRFSYDFMLHGENWLRFHKLSNDTQKMPGVRTATGRNKLQLGFRTGHYYDKTEQILRAVGYQHINGKMVYPNFGKIEIIPDQLYHVIIQKRAGFGWQMFVGKVRNSDGIATIMINESDLHTFDLSIDSILGRWVTGPWIEVEGKPVDFDLPFSLYIYER